MRRRSRTRWVLNWVGLGASTLLIVVWIVTTRLPIGLEGAKWTFQIQNGSIYFSWITIWKEPTLIAQYGEPDWYISRDVRRASFIRRSWMQDVFPKQTSGLCLENSMRSVPFFRVYLTKTNIPLWGILLVFLPPTIYLWRRNRVPAGHCTKCGSNLTGKVSGI